jgi:hypothetical protein
MVDMNALERQVAGEVNRAIGPVRPVDDLAVYEAVAAATQSPKWRFRSMFSATKFVVAGVIVALFGGFLLSGVLTQQPSDDRLPPVGASASATTQAEPTDAATAEPEPTGEAVADTTTELVPGVDLVTEEVAPGIYRVLSDGVNDLTKHVWDVAVTPDGEVWVVKQRVSYAAMKGNPDQLKTLTRDARVLRLGDEKPSYKPPASATNASLRLDAYDGRPFVSVSGLKFERGWTGESWAIERRPYCEGVIAPDEACWSRYPYDVRETSTPVTRTDLADYSEEVFTRDDLGLAVGESAGYRFALGADGTIWTDIYDGVPFQFSGDPDTFVGLASYDGEGWAITEAPATGIDLVERLAVGPDGEVWVAGLDLDLDDLRGGDHRLVAARYDGDRWEVLPELDGQAGDLFWWGHWDTPGEGLDIWDMHFPADGSAWFDPVTYSDGRDIHRLQLPDSVATGDLRIGPHAAGPDGSIWAVLIDMKDPDELGCAAQPARCAGVPGLYVITPEAVAE